MTNIKQLRNRTAYSVLAVAMLSVTAPAFAQTADDNGQIDDDVIVVTAQRRAQNLQDVPAAVTAISNAQLAERQITDTQDLAKQLPNVVISANTGTASAARIYFRGVGEDESRGAIDPAVGVYIDSVFLGRSVGALIDLVDIEQVEVLRGPQGTLYGRNTNGGAIKISSVRPQIGETSFAGEVGYGNFDRILARGTVNAGFADTGAVRLSALYKERDGFHTLNPNGDFAGLAGTEVGAEQVFAIRGSALGELNENWTALLAVDYTRDRTDPVPSSIIDDSDDPRVLTDADDDIFTIEPLPGATCSQFVPTNFEAIGCFNNYSSEVDAFGVSLSMEGDYDNFSLTSITAFRTLNDDLSTHITFPYFQETEQNQFSQELLFNSDFDSPVNLTAGAFYYSEDARLDFTFILPVVNEIKTESFALFGQASAELGDFTLTGGARWTTEDRDFAGTSPVTGGQPLLRETSIDGVTWTAKASYAFTDDILLYGSYSTGFKSPGFSADCFSPTACFLPVEEEDLDSMEVGLRTQFADGDVTLNATYFYNDYKGLQISATTADGSFTRVNAGEARIQGAELELSVSPFEGLDIYANGSWLDAEYRDLNAFQAGTLSNSVLATAVPGPTCSNVTAAGGTDAFNQQVIDCALGLELKNAPEWKGLVGFTYAFPVSAAGEIFFGGDAAYEDDSFALVANPPGSRVEPGLRLDARLGYRGPDDRFSVTLWGKNLSDREYFRATTSTNQVYAAPPLTFGVDVGFKFN